jgi:hypothetical protein
MQHETRHVLRRVFLSWLRNDWLIAASRQEKLKASLLGPCHIVIKEVGEGMVVWVQGTERMGGHIGVGYS